MRGCYFHPGTGLGVFGAIPIVAAGDGGSMPDARLGLRYSTATASLGAVIDPFLDSVTQLWAVWLLRLVLRKMACVCGQQHVLGPKYTVSSTVAGCVQ